MTNPIVAVWGLGFIGCTSAMAFAQAGCRVIGYDIDEEKIKSLHEGIVPIPQLEDWFGVTWASCAGLTATTKRHEVWDAWPTVHLICVPTERQGEPWGETVLETLNRCAGPWLKIIESTLDLSMWQQITHMFPSEPIAVSPRRDWFVSRAHSLRTMPRIYGAARPDVAEQTGRVLGLVCQDLQAASSPDTAILTKLIENEIVHLGANLAGELALRYPEVNVREAFELASSHWRTPLYYPSCGAGGHCVPLAGRYLLHGGRESTAQSLLVANRARDDAQPEAIAKLLARWAAGRLGVITIFGDTYRADTPVFQHSPARKISWFLTRAGVVSHTHDPYADDPLHPDAGRPWWRCLEHAAVILLHTDHREYAEVPLDTLLTMIRPGTPILDNTGAWARHREAFTAYGIPYHRLGEPGWMGKQAPDTRHVRQFRFLRADDPYDSTWVPGQFSRPYEWGYVLTAVAQAHQPAVHNVGCGDDDYTRAFARALGEVSSTVVNSDWRPQTGFANFRQHDVRQPCPESFDIVVCVSMLEEVAQSAGQTVEILDHLWAQVKPGGRLLLTCDIGSGLEVSWLEAWVGQPCGVEGPRLTGNTSIFRQPHRRHLSVVLLDVERVR